MSQVLNDTALSQLWQSELEEMRQRILLMRRLLEDKLSQALPDMDFSYLTQQQGMFSSTGLSAEQVDLLKQDYGTSSAGGRTMCTAGLNLNNIDYVGQASMATVLKAASSTESVLASKILHIHLFRLLTLRVQKPFFYRYYSGT